MRHQALHLLVALTFAAGAGALPFHSSAEGARATATSAATALTPQSAGPLPGGCGHVTPPGEDTPVCCVSGFVYMDGQPIAGAEVQVQNQDGDQVTLVTQVYSDSLVPSDRLNLSTPPLKVAEGAIITVTARYGGHERSVIYAVRAGGQHVDVVLARPQREGYVFERQLWGQAAPRQFNFPNGVATDRHGNIYVADWKNARVQVLGSHGQFIRQWGTLGNLPGQFNLPTDVALDASGNVYITDTGNHRIQKFSSVGQLIAVWGSYGRAVNQFDDPVGIAVDGNSVYVADSNNQRIQKFSAAGQWLATWDDLEGLPEGFQPQGLAANSAGFVYVVANAGIRKLNHDGHVVAHLTHPQADEPSGISIDSGDNIYVSDFECHCILRFDYHDYPLPAWGSGGSGSGQFDSPTDVAVDRDGNLYIADFANHRIQKLDSSGNWKASWGDYGRANGQFGFPSGVAVDHHGNIYVADTENDRIQKFGADGGHLATWTSARGIAGPFSMPHAIAIDKDERLYVSDQGRIIQLTSEGDGIAAWPYAANGIALDNSGNIYLTQSFQVLKLDGNGDLIKTWGSFGTADGQFRGASGIGIDSSGSVYVADGGNSRVQKFTDDGQFISAWGSSQYPQFQEPSGLAIDGAGKIYVAANRQLWKFQASGGLITRWGGAGVGAGEFGAFSPGGIDVGTNGRVYAADGTNNRVQVFRPMSFTKPIATINYLSATSLKAGDQLLGYGMGQDSDETPAIAAYRWSSNRDGTIGESAMLSPTVTLETGLHRLTFEVQDSDGEWSDPVSTSLYVVGSTNAQWTMLLYLAGDYQDRGRLLNAFNRALSELRSMSHPPSVRIAVQLDGPAVGDAVRLLIMPSAPATVISYGEQAMDDPAALADFVRWGQSSFPATHYYLAIADHGQGVQGVAWDHASDPGGDAYLTVAELGAALKAPGVAPIDVLHLDACSMNLLEVAYEVHQQARILVASQYLAWDYFAYPTYQRLITATTTPADLARGIVADYAALAHADSYPYTIAALNLERVPSARMAVDTLALHLIALIENEPLSRAMLNDIWGQSQKFESNGDYTIDNNDMYLDLVDWAERVRAGVDDSAVRQKAQNLIQELTEPQRLVIARRAESNPLPLQYAGGADIRLEGSHGLSIFYPQSHDSVAFDRYIRNQLFRFTGASRWPDFLVAGTGPIPPSPPREPLPGPLPPLTEQQPMFLPIVAR